MANHAKGQNYLLSPDIFFWAPPHPSLLRMEPWDLPRLLMRITHTGTAQVSWYLLCFYVKFKKYRRRTKIIKSRVREVKCKNITNLQRTTCEHYYLSKINVKPPSSSFRWNRSARSMNMYSIHQTVKNITKQKECWSSFVPLACVILPFHSVVFRAYSAVLNHDWKKKWINLL